jgi:integrase
VRHGKGNKSRRVPVANGALDALLDWLTVRGSDPDPLFVPINPGGRLVVGQHMTPQAVLNLLAKRGAEAKIPDFSPHDLRRTFISDLLDRGADIATVQKLAGHAQVTTTARYDRRGDRAKLAAVDLLSVPYTRRRLALP